MAKKQKTCAYTYIIVDKRDDSVVYVGKTIDPEARWKVGHVRSVRKRKRCRLARHMRKHGVEHFRMDVLYTFPFEFFGDQTATCTRKKGCPCPRCVAEDWAFSAEEELVARIKDAGGELMNMNDGGKGGRGFKFTDEHAIKHRLRKAQGRSALGRPRRGDKAVLEHLYVGSRNVQD